jgi:hypothetical protein
VKWKLWECGLGSKDFKFCALLVFVPGFYTWLNARNWGYWPTGSRGLPFSYETWCDAVPCLRFYGNAAIADLAVGLVISALLLRLTAARINLPRAICLVLYSVVYTWLSAAGAAGFLVSFLPNVESGFLFEALGVFATLIVSGAIGIIGLSALTTFDWKWRWCIFFAALFILRVIQGRLFFAGYTDFN